MAFDLYQYGRKNSIKTAYPVKLADGGKLLFKTAPAKRNAVEIAKLALSTTADDPMVLSMAKGDVGMGATDKPKFTFTGENAEYVVKQTLGKGAKEEAEEEPELKVG